MAQIAAVTQLPMPIPTVDGVIDANLFLPSEPSTASQHLLPPAVIFYMDAIAIRPALFSMASRLAANGYAVLLPNLYYRLGATGSYKPFDPLTLRDTPGERERMIGMMRTLTLAKVMADTRACIAALDRRPDVNSHTLGCVGYCMGGGMALTAAGTFPHRVRAAASFHGGSLATDAFDSPHLLAGKIQARLHIGVAELDGMFSAEQGARLQAALRAAGRDFVYEVYPGAKHGFAVTGHSMYDETLSERHWDRLLTLFQSTLHSPA